MAKLFKNKIIKQRLETFRIDDFEQKLEIVKKWHRDYHTGTLKADKEISRAPGWTQDFLGEILGYTRKPSENHTYDTEYTVAGQRPDFVLGYFHTGKNYIIGELKDAKTSLDAPQKREGSLTPVQQAFKYKGNLRDSSFVIVSNFFETRLYYDNYLDYELWTLDTLISPKEDYFQLRKFIYLLSQQNLISKRGESNTKGLISFIQIQQKEITKGFYKEYSLLRRELFKDIIIQAKKSGRTFQKSELDMILSKTQKIIDRIIFIHFCEDLDLLPQGKLAETVKYAENMPGLKVWEILKGFFEAVNSGSEKLSIPDGYNGGLFHKDEELNALEVGDEICKKFVALGEYDFEDDLSVNILGHIFEQSISDIEELKEKIQKNEEVVLSKRKKDGVFYTPEYIVDYIVKNSVGKRIEDWEQELQKKHNLLDVRLGDKGYEKKAILVYTELQEKLQNITVLDPACGSGAFLVKVFDFLLSKNTEISKTLEDLGVNQGLFSSSVHFKSILQNNIYGVDLNEESVEITKLSLWLKTAIKGKQLANLDSNIKCGNSLIDDPEIAGEKAFSWEVEFPQIFKDGGFDVIVGNPPYVRGENLGIQKDFFNKNSKIFNGNADLYTYFYEKSLDILKNNGILSFITPNKWIESNYGKQLRNLVLNFSITDIVNFGELQVFEDAGTFPMIISIEKNEARKDFLYKEVVSLENIEDIFFKSNKDIINQSLLSTENWIFGNHETISLLNKIQNNFSSLEKVLGSNFFSGVKTGLNGLFIYDEYEVKNITRGIEEELSLFKPIIFGRDFDKYSITNPKLKYIFFPYLFDGEKNVLINLSDYKNTFGYLNQFREKLSKRAIIKEGVNKGTHQWFELQQINKFCNYSATKIIYPDIASNNRFLLDEGGLIPDMTCFFMSGIGKECIPLLNSKVFKFLAGRLCPVLGNINKGGRIRYKSTYLKKIPVPQIEGSNISIFREKADFMLEKNKVMGEKTQKFLKRVQGTFGLEKLSKKLQAFYELDFADFVKELKKVKVILSLRDQDEWEEYFENYKTEIVELKIKIDACDREIDEMVFDLYGLTEEEREVVINS